MQLILRSRSIERYGRLTTARFSQLGQKIGDALVRLTGLGKFTVRM